MAIRQNAVSTARQHPLALVVEGYSNLITQIKTNSKWLGWLMAIGAVTAYSTSAPIGRGIIEGGLNPTSILLARFSIATILIGLTLLLTNPKALKIDRRGLMMCLIIGIINATTALSFFWALTRISASLGAMLVSVYPLIVLGLLALRGEKFTYRNTIRLALGLTGVFLIIGPGGQLDGLGVLLVFICAAGYALQLALTQWYLADYDVRTIAFYISSLMTVVQFGFWTAQGSEWTAPGWSGWFAIATMAVLGTYVARLAMFRAIREIGSGQTALLAPTETMLTVIWSLLFLQERLTLVQWSGSILIIASAILAVERLYQVKPRPFWRVWLRI